MARRTRSRAAARQGLARTRTHSATSETASSRLGRSQYRRRLRLEALEDRRLLAGITVTTLADTVNFNDGVTSLREAIFAANTVPGPDTIEFAPTLTANGAATILLTQGEIKITDSLTIDGPGAELLTIDASGNDPTPELNNRDGSRVFTAIYASTRPASPPHFAVDGLTLTGGDADAGGGGAIWSEGSLTMIDCVIRDNAADGFGGGVSLHRYRRDGLTPYADSRFIGCTFINNASLSGGGGVSFFDSSEVDAAATYISECVFASNSAGRYSLGSGGGVFVSSDKASVRIEDSVFVENTAGVEFPSSGSGGGMALYTSGSVDVVRCSVAFNQASDFGGGIYCRGQLTVEDCSILGNEAKSAGGGIASSGNTTILNSTISSNWVPTGGGSWDLSGVGGGIYCFGNLLLQQSTVTGNAVGTTALGGYGGGVAGSYVALDHSIVAGNTGGKLPKPNDLHGKVTLKYSLLGVDTRAVIEESVASQVGSMDAPIDPLLGPLADNGEFELPDGSRILTHALLAGSPAINAGDLNAVAGEEGVPEFDQRGEPFGRIVGGRIDIGAFEYQTPTDLNLLVDTLLDESDGDYSRGDLSLREAIELANVAKFAGVVDTIRFDPALWATGPATILLTQGELKITDSLTIDGRGAELLTIDANGSDPTPEINSGDGSRVFNIDSGTFSALLNVSIVGMALTGADSSALQDGGAIYARANLTINACLIFDNAAIQHGGGVRVLFGELTMSKSTIRGNFARVGGGISGAYVTVADSEISDNVAMERGGGIRGGIVRVDRSTIGGNTATSGGGIYGNSTVTVEGCTISDNSATQDGGSVYSSGSVTVLNSTVSDNRAGRAGGGIVAIGGVMVTSSTLSNNTGGIVGGGIRASGNVMVTSSTISGNSASAGGGINAHGAMISVVDCIVSGNSATLGGGLLGEVVKVIDSTISGNQATGDGGGVYFRHAGEITRSSISSNTANGDGGGVAALGTLKVIGSTVNDNAAAGRGGGIFTDRNSSAIDIRDSTISGNSAAQGGGVCVSFTNAWTISVTRSTVTANSATFGGGLFLTIGSLELDHSIIAKNWGSVGPDLSGLIGVDVDARFSLIGDNRQSGLAEAPVDSPDADGNLIGGPVLGVIDPLLGLLADNGGPTLTHANLPGSPTINAGDPAAVAGVSGVPVHDQRGAPFTRVFGGRIDMGAVEALPAGFLSGDFSGNGVVDAADYSVWRDRLGANPHPGPLPVGEGVIGDGNGDGKVDGLDYEVWKANFGAVGDELGTESGELGERSGLTIFQVRPPAEPRAEGRNGISALASASGQRTRMKEQIVGRRVSEIIEARRERLLDEWWAMRDLVNEDVAELDSGLDVREPVAVEAVDSAVLELGRLRLGLRG
jgi:CSLREA domain-containing protein